MKMTFLMMEVESVQKTIHKARRRRRCEEQRVRRILNFRTGKREGTYFQHDQHPEERKRDQRINGDNFHASIFIHFDHFSLTEANFTASGTVRWGGEKETCNGCNGVDTLNTRKEETLWHHHLLLFFMTDPSSISDSMLLLLIIFYFWTWFKRRRREKEWTSSSSFHSFSSFSMAGSALIVCWWHTICSFEGASSSSSSPLH